MFNIGSHRSKEWLSVSILNAGKHEASILGRNIYHIFKMVLETPD